jgi:hypothetical protein
MTAGEVHREDDDNEGDDNEDDNAAQLRGLDTTTAPAHEALALVQAVVTASGGGATTETATATGPADLLAALTVLRHLRDELTAWEPRLITAARRQGVSWAELAPALGVTSRQAAERRYLRLHPSATGEQTGEERVQAERTKRAGNRAVAAWARQNSSALRQLAGQISALEGLSGAAQQHVDLVHQALADNDAATLLSPLADTQAHLEATHAGLAEQIKSVTDHTEQLRRHTHEQRNTT